MLGFTCQKRVSQLLAIPAAVAVFALAASETVVRAQVSNIDPFGSLGELTNLFELRVNDSASLAADATPVFADAFRPPTLDDRRWEFAAGATWIADAYDGGISLAAGDDRALAELRSRAFDLSAYSGARVRIRATRIGDAAPQLDVEYAEFTGFWARATAVATSGSGDTVEYELPEPALHKAAQIRLRTNARAANREAWLVREIAIFGRSVGSDRVFSVDAKPELPIPLTLRVSPGAQLVDAAMPLRLTVGNGMAVQLVAPAVFEGFVLSHWLVDSATRIERQRGVAVISDAPKSVVAEYRPVRADDLAYLAIRAEPDADIPLTLAPAGMQIGERVITNRIVACLRGESIVLTAPTRTARLVFDGWRLGGGREVNSPTLELSVDSTQSITAEYVVLGDMNSDGALDAYDVDLFCDALKQPDHPPQTRAGIGRGDMNGDGLFDETDIEEFVERLVSP